MTTLFFILTILFSITATAGLLKARRLRFMIIPWFVFSWFGSEMPIWVLSFQILIIIATYFFIDISTIAEQSMMALALWNCVALIHSHKRNVTSGIEVTLSFEDQSQLKVKHFLSESLWQKPFSFRNPSVKRVQDIEYGQHDRHKLDIYYGKNPKREKRPVLLQIHGGAWTIGNKHEQSLPLLYTMAANDWICVACNYRLGPKDRFPSMIEDIELCLAWIKKNIQNYGGDPDFICCTGGSAGGHLSSLLSLRNQKDIKACVPYYGIYDFHDSHNIRREMSMESFLEKSVMPGSIKEYPLVWDAASPILHTKGNVVPFLIIHGTHDSLAFSEEADKFCQQLNKDSQAIYLPVFGAQHAFDLIWSERNKSVIEIVFTYLENQYLKGLQQERN